VYGADDRKLCTWYGVPCAAQHPTSAGTRDMTSLSSRVRLSTTLQYQGGTKKQDHSSQTKCGKNAFDETIATKRWAEIKVVRHAKVESRLCKRVCTSKAKYHCQHPSNSMHSFLNAKHHDRKPLCRLTRLCPRSTVKQGEIDVDATLRYFSVAEMCA
jgi:hypothetical protein